MPSLFFMKITLRFLRVLSVLVLAGSALSAFAINPYTLTVTPSATSYSAAGGNLTFTVNMSYTAAIWESQP
jgi:hypothetical protein